MITTILFDLTIAIMIGVGIALIHMVIKLSRLGVSYADIDLKRMNITDEEIIKKHGKGKVAYISGPVMFANAEKVEAIESEFINHDRAFLSMRGVSDIDITGAQSMMLLVEKLQHRGTKVIVCGFSDNARLMANRSGLTALIGEENIFWSIDKALLSELGTIEK